MEEKRSGRDALSQLPPLALRVSTALAFSALIAVKLAAKAGFLVEKPTATVKSPLKPVSWAFGIWVFLYVLQGAGTVFQLLPHGYSPDGSKQRIVNTVGYGWQVGWYAQLVLELASLYGGATGAWTSLGSLFVAMAGFAWTLLGLYRLKDQHGPLSNVALYILYFLPTTVNTAWLSFLTAMSLASLPAIYSIHFHTEALAAVMDVCVACTGVYVVHRYRDSAYGLTLVWSNVALYGQQQSAPLRFVALACTAACFLISLASVLRRRHTHTTELADLRSPLRGERSGDAAREAV